MAFEKGRIVLEENKMKVRASVKKLCKTKIIRRRVSPASRTNRRHKRQRIIIYGTHHWCWIPGESASHFVTPHLRHYRRTRWTFCGGRHRAEHPRERIRVAALENRAAIQEAIQDRGDLRRELGINPKRPQGIMLSRHSSSARIAGARPAHLDERAPAKAWRKTVGVQRNPNAATDSLIIEVWLTNQSGRDKEKPAPKRTLPKSRANCGRRRPAKAEGAEGAAPEPSEAWKVSPS
jgi:ribosomal protein L36